MSFNSILKRASSLLGFIPNDQLKQQYDDGDIVYTKNNVCVHTPSQYRGDGSGIHHPGYMVVKCHAITSKDKSLSLTWIPNDKLKRNHELIHQQISDESMWESQQGSDLDTISINSTNLPEMKLSKLKEAEDTFDAIEENKYDVNNCSKSVETSFDCGIGFNSPSSFTPTISTVEGDISIENKKTSSTEGSTSGVYSSCDISEASPIEQQTKNNINNQIQEENEEIETLKVSNDISQAQEVSTDKQEPLQVSVDKSMQQQPLELLAEKQTEQESLEVLAEKQEPFEVTSEKPITLEPLEVTSEKPITLEPLEVLSVNNQIPSSSSDSSSDNDKFGKNVSTVAETSESSCHVETNSDEEISLEDSSTDLQASPPPRYFSSKARDQWYDRSVESMAFCANLAFPESHSNASSMCPTPIEGGSSPIRRHHKSGIFSVDIGQMKSLRLFFSDKEQTCGQLVIASQESQYKILHFHHGGLDKLANVFEDWNFLIGYEEEVRDPDVPQDRALKQFSVCRPQIQDNELHPEEGSFDYLDAETWLTYFTEDGIIEDELGIRRSVFLGGLEPQLRTNVWPFLLHYYDFRTTFIQRQIIMEEKHQLYVKINNERESLSGEDKEKFWKSVQCTVEKDVVRTDRSKRCFAGRDNPNIEKMKNILLNFAHYNPEIGYTQGMSDILAPILAEVRTEADVFWCFAGMMSKTIFVTSPRDQDMEKNLKYLCELLRIMVPSFYEYVAEQEGGMDLLFCHRWILLCFKREFDEDEVLSMWEACWSNYQTDYFHLFLVVAIISIYGKEVTEQRMRPDEMLLYFTSLANHMDGYMVLKKARGLLHQFRSKERIPCTLVGLCELCGPGMWDSGHAPIVECRGHDNNSLPCYLTQSSSTSAGNPTEET